MALSVEFELAAPVVAGGPGLSGLVAAIDPLLPRQNDAIPLDASVLLAGLAFRAYELEPADNHALDVVSPEKIWAADAIDVDNYGALEALGGHFAVGPKTYRAPKLAEAFALVFHELEAGRAVVAELRGGTRWAHVVGVKSSKKSARLPDSSATLPPLAYEIVADAAVAPAIASLTVVRPLPTGAAAGASFALQHDVLTFGRRHLRQKHELVHHAELFYATGVRAFSRFATLAALHAPPAGLLAHVESWLAEKAWSRRAGARGAAHWAAAIDAHSPLWRTPAGGSAALRRLAAALADSANALERALAATEAAARAEAISGAMLAEATVADELEVLGAGGLFG